MTNAFLFSLWLFWAPSPETNVVGYKVLINSLAYTTDQPIFHATNLPPGRYTFCVSAVDNVGLESLPTCITNDLLSQWVVVSEYFESSSNLTLWVPFQTNTWTNWFDGQQFYRTRYTIQRP